MNNRSDSSPDTLDSAFREINEILEKYDLCGAVTLISGTKGQHRFYFQPWSAMQFGINDDGYPYISAIIKLKGTDFATCHALVNNCYEVSNYFQEVLSEQSQRMQKVNDDLCTAFNLDREAIETDCDCKNLH